MMTNNDGSPDSRSKYKPDFNEQGLDLSWIKSIGIMINSISLNENHGCRDETNQVGAIGAGGCWRGCGFNNQGISCEGL